MEKVTACLKNISCRKSVRFREKCLYRAGQHSHPGSVECPALGSNKLFISGSSSFGLAEYFSFLGRNCRFACHTEVVMLLETSKLEPDPAVKC